MRTAIYTVLWLLGLCLLPLVALASEDVPRHEWGETDGHSWVLLQRCETPDCDMAVTFHNEMTYPAVETEGAALTLQGWEVQVLIAQGAGHTADTVTVVPPPGFMAVPSEVTVEEDHEGIITLVPIPMG